MLNRKSRLFAVASALALTLCACGGGGGSSPSFAPPPPQTPPPPSAPPADAAPFGVTADATFATVGDDIHIRWDHEAGVYELQLAGAGWDILQRAGTAGVSTEYYPPSSAYVVRLRHDLPYSYTNLAEVAENGWGMRIGNFAYGVPTSPQNMPVVGSATYTANLFGTPADEVGVIGGTGLLSFDFAAGTLAGYLDPILIDPTGLGFESTALGRYTFVNSVYSTGSTSFSGKLSHTSVSGLGSFSGVFTGPLAQELMADWSAPMINPINNQPSTMSGVLIGKK